MPASTSPLDPRPIRIGSLLNGYRGLDLAVEHATGGETVWFSEINDPLARVFARHWPDAPNLGDITTVNWSQVTPVDVLCRRFPCQDVSTVETGRPCTRHPLGALLTHGRSHRRAATPAGRDRGRAA